jgi:hypothetical protein
MHTPQPTPLEYPKTPFQSPFHEITVDAIKVTARNSDYIWSHGLRIRLQCFLLSQHEHRSNFNHKKHLSDAFTHSFIFSTILWQKYKNIFSFLHTQPKPKNTITASYLIYCICYDISFYLLLHLVLDNHSVELGTQDEEIVLQVAWRRTSGAFSTVPREFNIKPQVPLWGKFTLATTLCTWRPDELAPLLSVITWSCYNTNIGYVHHSIYLMAWSLLSIDINVTWSGNLIIIWPMS